MEIVRSMLSIQVSFPIRHFRYLIRYSASKTNLSRISGKLFPVAGSLSMLPKKGILEVSLTTLKYEIYTISPIKVSKLTSLALALPLCYLPVKSTQNQADLLCNRFLVRIFSFLR